MPSLLDTVISSKLKCAGSFDLCFELLVIIYLDLFEIFKGLIESCFHVLHTKLYMKQNLIIRPSLIDRSNTKQNTNELHKSIHLVMPTIQ